GSLLCLYQQDRGALNAPSLVEPANGEIVMSRIFARGTVFALTLLVLAGISAGTQAGGSKKVYKSPQEVFEAAKKAGDDRDIKGFIGCITAESRDTAVGGLVLAAGLMKAFAKFAKEEDKDKLKKLDELLEKHGLTEDVFKKREDKKVDLNDPEQAKMAMREL